MALTNDQITAQNFKDFYGQIRPYLNGQVPTFANQFSRSDLYSTSEKIIGQWEDGKPLYQKTVDCGALPNNTTKSVAHGVSNLDKIVDIKGCTYRSSDGLFVSLPRVATSTTYMCEINVKSGNVNITSSTDLSAFGWSWVTIQYTKTTDSAIKVGTGTDYSTEEQIIGTWIDGKPIYQKTIVLLNQTNINDTTVDIAENVDILISKEITGFRKTDVAKNPVYIPYVAPTATIYDNYIISGFFKDLNSNNNKLIWQWQVGATQSGRIHDFYITVRYTKTTDV